MASTRSIGLRFVARAAIAVLALAMSIVGTGATHTPREEVGIPVPEYRERRNALMAGLPDGVVVLRGAVEEEFGEVGRFAQNPTFMYVSGCEAPGAFVVLNPFAPDGSRDTLYLPARDPGRERWTGPQLGPGADAVARFGFSQVKEVGTLAADVAAALKSQEVKARIAAGQRVRIYTVVPRGLDGRFSRDQGLVERLQEVARGEAPEVEVADATSALAELRRSKSRNEVALLRRAIEITAEAQSRVSLTIAPGRFEYEVEAEIVATFLRNGASGAGFPSIVGSGRNSTVLHYMRNEKRIDAGDLVVVDIGASYRYYVADITRTWPSSGTFSPRQREVYQLVLDAQRAAAEGYKPGMRMADLHRIAAEVMRKSPLRDRTGNTLDRYFLHGLGHFLGMEVHDVGDMSSPLRPGDVITIEPGIYIADEKLGVRIEDDYLVTKDGLEKLSRDVPSSPDDIEKLMQKR